MDNPSRPLVVLTREPADNESLREQLLSRGLAVLQVPCASTAFVDTGPIKGPVGIIVFTSRRGVQGFFRLQHARKLLDQPETPVIAAVGHSTAQALVAHGLVAQVIADPPNGRQLARQLQAAKIVRGGHTAVPVRVVMVRGNLHASEVDDLLVERGYELAELIVYENVVPHVERMEPIPLAAVMVASPSAARRLLAANPWMTTATFVVPGVTTAAQVRSLGVEKVLVAGADPSCWAGALCDAALTGSCYGRSET